MSDTTIWHSVVDLLRGSATYRRAAPDVEVIRAIAAGAQQHASSDEAVQLTRRARDLMGRIAIEASVRQSVLAEGATGAAEVADLLASGSSKNIRDRASRMRRKGELLGVNVAARVLYPAFQIDAARAALRPGVGDVNLTLNAAGTRGAWPAGGSRRMAGWGPGSVLRIWVWRAIRPSWPHSLLRPSLRTELVPDIDPSVNPPGPSRLSPSRPVRRSGVI